MTISEDEVRDPVGVLLADLARAEIRLALRAGDQLSVTAPKGRLSPPLRTRIQRYKPQLLAWLSGGRADEPPPIVPRPDRWTEPFPPADIQTSFLIGSRAGFEYHVRPHQYMEIDLPGLDPARFERAVNRALRRHAASLVTVGDDLMLHPIRDLTPVRIPVIDLPADGTGLHAVRDGMERAELPLDRWPWFDMRISRRGPGTERLHYNNNNFFADAPGTGRLLQDVLHYYDHPDEPLPDLELSYRDCVLALSALEESAAGQRSRTYWCDRMANWPDAPALPLATGADTRGRSRLVRHEHVLAPPLWASFSDRARAHGLTLTNVLCAVYAEVLARWSGSRHFLINNMNTHRLPMHPQIREVVGNFSSLYPLEVDWRADEPFADRARRLQNQVVADMQHLYWSGVKVLQALNQLRRTPGKAICPYAVGSALFVGPTDRPVYSTLETPQVLLDCEFWEQRDGSMWTVWDAIDAMFPPGMVDEMLAGYGSILTDLATSDDAWRRHTFGGGRPATTTVAPVPDRLLHHGNPAPDRPAVVIDDGVTDDGVMDYAELDRRADGVAAAVGSAVGAHGARVPLVAVVLPKGPHQIVAVHGVLRAGCAYVPMDPGWPDDRIRLLVEDAAVAAVVTDTASAPRLSTVTGLPTVTADRTGGPGGGSAGARRQEDLAYVIYTSGSTGRPKGAMLDHRGPVNTIADINARFGVTDRDVVFGISSLCFDLSVYDVFGSYAAGAALLLPGPGHTDPASWVRLAQRHGVTVWNSVPALMQLFTEAAAATGTVLPDLRLVLLSGDWIPVPLPAQIRTIAPNARVVSLGGATEASIWSIWHPADDPDPTLPSIPYGRPLANQTWHILDDAGQDAPTWVPGHLYIGGTGLALGYLNDPDRTAAAFVAHPRTGERLYRTGDLGRFLPDGSIEFLGRADFQVKIQGFRVEPGEVEQAILAHPGVRNTAVVARTAASGRQLAAFVVGDVSAGDLRAFLTDRLPNYLIPSHIGLLDALPLTGNGKLDRRALELFHPDDGGDDRRHTAPATPTERALVAIWEEVLGTTPIGVHDDFFDLGGQSFAALRVSARIGESRGHAVPLGALLERRTVAALAEWLDTAAREGPAGWTPLVKLHDVPDARPWFLVHPSGGNVACYRALARHLTGGGYGLQAPAPQNWTAPLEDIVAGYVEAIRTAQPDGPYAVAGWSSGAVLAAEVVRQLEAGGGKVDRLVVIDAPAPLRPRVVDEEQLRRWYREDHGDADGVDLYDTFRAIVRACNSYRARPVSAPVTVIRARDGAVGEFSDHPARDRPDWGWADVGTVRCVRLPGTHHTLLTGGSAAAVARAMQSEEGYDRG